MNENSGGFWMVRWQLCSSCWFIGLSPATSLRRKLQHDGHTKLAKRTRRPVLALSRSSSTWKTLRPLSYERLNVMTDLRRFTGTINDAGGRDEPAQEIVPPVESGPTVGRVPRLLAANEQSPPR